MVIKMILTWTFLASFAAGQGDVWVVDAAGGGDFELLDNAIAAAGDGDILLIRPGIYFVWSVIDNKSLSFQGDNAEVRLRGRIQVQNLVADRSVIFRDLDWKWPAQLNVVNSEGLVWVDDSRLEADLYGGSENYGAIYADNASNLVITNTQVFGSIQYGYHTAPPTDGIYATDSTVYLHNSLIVGGAGIDTIYPDLPGAEGVTLIRSSLSSNGSLIRGGSGQTERGGDGLIATDAQWHRQATDARGGDGNPQGDPMNLDPSSNLSEYQGLAYEFSVGSPVRYGESLHLQYQGQTGDTAWLLLSFNPQSQFLPQFNGSLLLDLGQGWLSHRGQIPGSGTLQESFPVPSFPGLSSVHIMTQALYSDGEILVLGPASNALLIDPQY